MMTFDLEDFDKDGTREIRDWAKLEDLCSPPEPEPLPGAKVSKFSRIIADGDLKCKIH